MITMFQEGPELDDFEAAFNEVANLFRDDAGHSIMNISNSIDENTSNNLLQTAWKQNLAPTTVSCSIDDRPELKQVRNTRKKNVCDVRACDEIVMCSKAPNF
jgi:hypothetical protein